MTTLQKDFRFEAAHRLAKGYCGKCANIHGHSWIVKVAVMAKGRMDEFDMAIDYAQIKSICNPLIELFDHAIILWDGDKPSIEFCYSQDFKTVLLPRNPTSESIAEFLFHEWELEFDHAGAILVSVIVEETCTARCEYTGRHSTHVMD